MSTTKVLLVAVLAAFALQVSSNKIPAVNGAFDDAIDLAEQVLKTVTEIVDDAITVVTETLNAIISDLQDYQQDAEAHAKEIVEAELKELNELIDNVKANTSGIVKEVLECIESVEDDLSVLEEYALTQAAVCTNGSIATVVQDAEQLVTDFSSVPSQIAAQDDALEACKSESNPLLCIHNVVENLIKIVSAVPAEMSENVNKIKNDWKALEALMKQCRNNVVPNLKAKAKVLKEDFIKCVS